MSGLPEELKIRLTKDQKSGIKQEAEKQSEWKDQLSESEIARRAIHEYLLKRNKTYARKFVREDTELDPPPAKTEIAPKH